MTVIAFSRHADHAYNPPKSLWLFDTATSTATQLTHPSGTETDTCPQSDGTWIYYIHNWAEIRKIRPNGADDALVFAPSEVAILEQSGLALSHDGTKLAVYVSGAVGPKAVLTVGVDGTGDVATNPWSGGSDVPQILTLSWSLDGSKLALQVNDAGGNTQIQTVNADGSGLASLTSTSDGNYLVGTRADGKILWIDYAAFPDDVVHAINFDGTGDATAFHINPDALWQPLVTPNGLILSIDTDVGDTIYKVDGTTGTVTTLRADSNTLDPHLIAIPSGGGGGGGGGGTLPAAGVVTTGQPMVGTIKRVARRHL